MTGQKALKPSGFKKILTVSWRPIAGNKYILNWVFLFYVLKD
jgi:hypothetical protein